MLDEHVLETLEIDSNFLKLINQSSVSRLAHLPLINGFIRAGLLLIILKKQF